MYFQCCNCGFSTIKIDFYEDHLKIHRFNKNAIFKCMRNDCGAMLSSIKKFKTHLLKNHTNLKFINNIKKYLCNVTNCNASFHNERLLNAHLQNHIKSQDVVKCPYECGNQKRFTNPSTFRGHLFRCHQKNIVECNNSGVSQEHAIITEEIQGIFKKKFSKFRNIRCS